MRLPNEWATKITDKNPDLAKKAAKHLVNNKDMDAWSCLAEHEESMFDFIKDKVCQYIIESVDENNYYNLYSLMQRYNDWLADVVALSLSKFDDNTINNQMLEYLINGDTDQQAYAARYFTYVNFPNAETVLIKVLESTDETVRINAAEALGSQQSSKAFDVLLNRLNNEDDFKKIEAAELLSAFNDPRAIKPILQAMMHSNMKENMASEAASIDSLTNCLTSNDEELKILALDAMDNIIIGLGEILPLGNVIAYDFYSCMDTLLKLAETEHSSLNGKYAQILIRAKNRFKLLNSNDQYTFDEDKETKEEINHIHNILDLRDITFWDDLNYLLAEELDSQDLSRKANAINTVAEVGLAFASEKLINIVCNDVTPELILCEAVYALQELKCTDAIPHLKKVLLRVENENRAAIIQNAISFLESTKASACN